MFRTDRQVTRTSLPLGRSAERDCVRSWVLRNLAPKIQEELLFLPATRAGSDAITEKHLRALVKVVDWESQMELFRELTNSLYSA